MTDSDDSVTPSGSYFTSSFHLRRTTEILRPTVHVPEISDEKQSEQEWAKGILIPNLHVDQTLAFRCASVEDTQWLMSRCETTAVGRRTWNGK